MKFLIHIGLLYTLFTMSPSYTAAEQSSPHSPVSLDISDQHTQPTDSDSPNVITFETTSKNWDDVYQALYYHAPNDTAKHRLETLNIAYTQVKHEGKIFLINGALYALSAFIGILNISKKYEHNFPAQESKLVPLLLPHHPELKKRLNGVVLASFIPFFYSIHQLEKRSFSLDNPVLPRPYIHGLNACRMYILLDIAHHAGKRILNKATRLAEYDTLLRSKITHYDLITKTLGWTVKTALATYSAYEKA